MLKTIQRENDPNRPKASGGHKWKEIIKPIWDNRFMYNGKGVVVIPSDPNAPLERLDLLLASKKAGHMGVRNELVS